MHRLTMGFALAGALMAAGPGRAQSTEARVTAIASIRSASSASFSPDGTRVAYVTNVSGSPQVWIAPVAGGAPVQVTRLADPVQSVRWSPRGDWLAYELAPGGGFNVQVYVAHPDGSGAKLLTAGGGVNNRLDGWSHDGRWLAYETNRNDATRFDAFVVDPDTGQTKPVGKAASLSTVTDIGRDGRRAVVSRLASRGDNNLYLADLERGSEVLLTPHSPTAEFSGGDFSPDGRRIYLLSDAGRDLTAFAAIQLDPTGKPGAIRTLAARADAEADAEAIDEAGRRAALVWNVAGRSELALLDLPSGRLTATPRLPGDIIGGLTFSQDGRTLAFTAGGAAQASDIWLMDVATGKATQLTHSPHDGVDLAALARPTLLTYRAHDGVALSGWLYRPAGARGPGPVVFIYHGGPEGQSRPGLSTDVQALVAKGISVFLPNVRGSTGYGKAFLNLDNGPLRVNGVKDIKATTDALVAKGIADPLRLGIMGGSYGGYMVMAGITEYPDMFAAAADLYGVVNFETFFQHTQPWMAAISTVEYGDPKTQAEMLRALSPIHKLDRIKTPLIVLHGANDTNVPVIEAEQIVASLKARAVPVDYVLFPDEGHGWRRLPNRIRSTVTISNFFEQHLTGPKP
ncbi:MAG: hypothetical protein JWP50_3190 [Phenylobacterium sp.]|nr:hypothetical protein [Phenylobacterium sp.]